MQLFHYIATTLLSSFLASNSMDSLESPFTVEVNGKPITKIGDSDESRTQAKIAAGTDAAVFTLKDGRLQCGGWMLGRSKMEDRSFGPKRVMWFNVDGGSDSKERIHAVTAEKDGDSYKLLFNGMSLLGSGMRFC
jgi:hypothetical protein